MLAAAAALSILVALAVAALLSGLGDERLRMEAQDAIAALSGDAFETTIGATGLSFDGLSTLALEVRNVRLAPRNPEEEGIEIGKARFGLRFLPLLRGEISLGRMRVEDAQIGLSAIARPQNDQTLALFDENGLLDQDAAIAAVFDGARHMAAILDARDVDRIRMDNVAVLLPGGPDTDALRVIDARLLRTGADSFALDAAIEIMGRTTQVNGELERDAPSGRIGTLDVRIDMPAEEGPGSTIFEGHRLGALTLSLSGSQTGAADRLVVSARAKNVDFEFDPQRSERLVTDIDLAATMLAGAGKVEVDDLRVSSGRSQWRFHGAFGNAPDVGAGYRFELVSDGSVIAPQGSTEAPLQAVARISGHLDASAQVLDISEIGIRSSEGEVSGSTVVRLEPGLTPGLQLRLDVTDMTVSQVKQLWPWFAARSAHNWVLANVFGGRVETGRIEIDAAPGRINDGMPFGPDELSGRFDIRGTRFDVAGRIPAVRDGVGVVAFAGLDVDISLQSGTVFMSGNRTVNATNGTLTIRDASQRPLIGKLKIDVEGEADAILQLARYDPIDVSRFIDIAPDELSGDVNGTIFADIPFQRETRIGDLDWRVDLAYKNLSLARPFEGQKVSAATGSIVVDPQKAVIEASAQLNAAPASIRLVEPLGSSDVERERRVALQMDDAARRAIAPGLDALLSGTVRVELDDLEGSARTVRANLDRALLNIPWLGWSKGNGIPASVAFAMQTDGGRTTLSDFRLSGDTFGANGTLSLVDGDVRSVSLSSARLNRGDDFSVDVRTQGGGYAVAVRGKSIDARSVVKLYAGDADGGGGQQAAATPVNLDLSVDTMSGFHNEVLRNVTLRYSGTGTRTGLLEFSATTRNGHPVTFRDARDGNVRSVSMNSTDAGAVLRFLDLYEHMEGGSIALTMRGIGDGPLSGQIDARDFWVVNEPRLRSLVASPAGGGRSLNQAVRGDIDTTRVQFERAFSLIDKGTGYLNLERGVLRGPLIGSTFQGTLYDAAGNMDMTGTFMPAYGLNRIFGEIPLIGQLLGNGRDRGLIGITFRLAGKSGEPQLQVNPLSVIAPGIFRSVFEYR